MSLQDTQAQLNWQRFSLLSIFKSVFLIFAALLVLAWNLLENIASGRPEDDSLFEMLLAPGWIGLLIGIGILFVLILFTLGIGYMQWKRKEFAFSTEAVHMRSGIFVKTNESLPYARIQTVEIERTIFDRLFQMASLKIDTGADATEAMTLGLLPYEKTAPLRTWLLAASNAARQGMTLPYPPAEYASNFPAHMDGEVAAVEQAISSVETTISSDIPTPEPTQPTDILIYRLSLKNLILTKIISLGFWGIFGGITVFVTAFLSAEFSFVAFLFAAIGLFSSVFSRLSKQWDTRLFLSDNGVRLRAGLTTVTSRTIAPERVHLITIQRGLIMRLLDVWSLSVTYPGIDADSDDARQSLTLIPLGSRADIERVLWLFANNLGVANPAALLDECMCPRKQRERHTIGNLEGVRQAFYASERVHYINPFSWRWSALVCTDEVALKRSRTLLRDSIAILFHEHWQSIALSQGAVARKLNVASLRICLVEGGFVVANYPEADVPVAMDVLRGYAQKRRSEQGETLRAWHERCQALAPALAIPER